jgi:hypothetical protein
MRVNRSLALPGVLACSLVILAALFGACSGGNSTAVAKPGPLVCDTLATGSYHYTEHVVLAVSALSGLPSPPPVPTASGSSHSVFSLSTDLQGSVQGANIDATIHTDTGSSVGDYEVILLADNQGFVKLSNGWQKADNTSNRPVPLPYQPDQVCKALAPDVDTTKLGAGQPETVNGVSSQRFTLQALPTSFFANEPDFGVQSDVGAHIKTLDGTIWVADQGNFITKLDIIGTGQYPNGQLISVKVTFELLDLGADIKIAAPL